MGFMVHDTLYDDGLVQLDDNGITLRRYYFPLATSKHIRYQDIRGVEARPMNWLTGKGRLWGTGTFRYWLPLDTKRPSKNTLVVLDVGGKLKPAFSPDDADQVVSLIQQRIGR